MKNDKVTRRVFLTVSTCAAMGAAFAQKTPNTAKVIPRKLSPNDKLNLA